MRVYLNTVSLMLFLLFCKTHYLVYELVIVPENGIKHYITKAPISVLKNIEVGLFFSARAMLAPQIFYHL